MCQHFSGVLHKQSQEVILLARKRHLAIAHPHIAAEKIDRQIADPEHRALNVGLQAVAQSCPHTRKQFIHLNGSVTPWARYSW